MKFIDKKFLLIFGLLFLFPGVLRAGVDENISGFVWSENIGWISFNNTSGGGETDYGVSVSPTTGLFSGFAWSENIGWIDFAPTGPYPTAPNYSACLDFQGNGQDCDDLPGNNKVGGWARALANDASWDGWIKLNGSNYGVDYNKQTGELSGYAWGNEVIGWINFSGINYGATYGGGQTPGVSTDSEIWNYCADSRHPILNWTYEDGVQASYQIQIDDSSASFPSPEVDTGEVASASASYVPTYNFNWDTRYYWRVKAKNQSGIWSNWSNVDNFNTPEHAYPDPDFTWLPQGPNQGEIVIFDSSSSQTYGGSTIGSYLWTITQGSGQYVDDTSNNVAEPHIIFSNQDNAMKLQIIDSDNFSCESSEQSISAQLPLPEYKEVKPASWLKKIFTQLWTNFRKFATL